MLFRSCMSFCCLTILVNHFILSQQDMLFKVVLDRTSALLQPTLEAHVQALQEVAKWKTMAMFLLSLGLKPLLPITFLTPIVLSSEKMGEVD